MANGYFERGEIYKVRMDYGMGCEEGAFRPGLIISSDRVNNTSGIVLVAYMSRKSVGRPRTEFDIEIEATGIASYVLCAQIAGVDKSRLMGFMGKTNAIEQKKIDDVLERIIDLGYVDEAALKEKDSEIANRDVIIGDLQAEVAGVKAEVEKKDNEIVSLKMEIEMWQKCYGRCMDMLVDVKVNGDVARRTAVVEPKVGLAASLVPDLRPEPPKQPETPPVEEDRLDINNCTATALKKAGFSLAVARKIAEGRPYASVGDLKRVNGVKASLYRILEPKLCCNPVVEKEPEKVMFVKDGPDPGYEKEEPVIVEKPVVEETRKVNVNTASAKEIAECLGISVNMACAITGKRKREGLFTSLEQIIAPGRFTKGSLEKYRDKLEV